MAKSAKPKRATKPPSIHSRASKRQPPPPDSSLVKEKGTSNANDIDDDVSIKTKTKTRPLSHPLALAPHANNGITKKKSKGKPLSRQQRLRLEKGLERAEVNLDKLESKVERSLGRNKRVKDRSGGWEEVNGSAVKELGVGIGAGGEVKRKAKRVVTPSGGGSAANGQKRAKGAEKEDEWEDIEDGGDDAIVGGRDGGDVDVAMLDSIHVPSKQADPVPPDILDDTIT
ncbi:hypothetical protein MMC25_007632 [Agyrium rufum]|nr:hypothetical protein [Agyrium rufum]